jgi:glycosyltransferase involved in cell wall biosynthesis
VKVIALSTSDSNGGAAIAARRLHQGLVGLGADCELWVQRRGTRGAGIVGPDGRWPARFAQGRLLLDQLPVLWSLRHRRTQFSPSWMPGRLARQIVAAAPGVVHLHWVNKGWLRIEDIGRWAAPTLWTLHDMWPFTGGCHYDEGCGRWRGHCGACPQLGSRRDPDVASWVQRRKQRAFHARPPFVVSPSRWLANCARESAVLDGCETVVIPNGLDLSRYRPLDRARCRARFGIPDDLPLIAFGAMNSTTDRRKGYAHLAAALSHLGETQTSLRLLVYGGKKENGALHGVPLHGVGRVDDESTMVDLLNAADVFVAPSEQDNLPNTVVEALACGCPVVAFDIGGMPDLVVAGRTGFLAPPFDSTALAGCILQALRAGPALRAGAREHAEAHYELGAVARRYLELYRELAARRT